MMCAQVQGVVLLRQQHKLFLHRRTNRRGASSREERGSTTPTGGGAPGMMRARGGRRGERIYTERGRAVSAPSSARTNSDRVCTLCFCDSRDLNRCSQTFARASTDIRDIYNGSGTSCCELYNLRIIQLTFLLHMPSILNCDGRHFDVTAGTRGASFSSAQALYFALVVRNSNNEGKLDA